MGHFENGEASEDAPDKERRLTDHVVVEESVAKAAPDGTSPGGFGAGLRDGSHSSILSELGTKQVDIPRKISLRLCAFVANILLGLAAWSVVGQFANLVEHADFDPTTELSIRVSGCDVNLVGCPPAGKHFQCKEGLGVVQVKWSVYSVRLSFTYKVDQDLAIGIVAHNLKDCRSYPGSGCAAFCTINVFVPPSAAKVSIAQESKDQEKIKITIADVDVSSVVIAGGDAATEIRNAIIRSKLHVKSGGGQILMRNSSALSSVLSAVHGNVVIYDENAEAVAGGGGMDINYRSTSGRSCFAEEISGENSSIVLDPSGMWSECDLSWPNGAFAKAISRRYDRDRSGQVAYSEFEEGIAQLAKCCGSKCPFASSCASKYLDDFFPLGVTKIDIASFVDMVRARNDTTIVPGCTRKVTIGNCSRPAGCPTYRLFSDFGKVFVFRQSAHLAVQPSSANRSIFTIQNAVLGSSTAGDLSMLKRSADFIKSSIKARLSPAADETIDTSLAGRLGVASDSLVVFFRVSESPGVPHARFVYSNKPVYFTLEPALLRTVSFGLLRPEIMHVDVGFYFSGCFDVADVHKLNATEKSRRIALMAAQILEAISDSRKEFLLQNLVFVDEEHTLEAGALHRFVLDSSSGALVLVDFVPDPVALACFYLSLIIGLLVAIMVFFVVRRVGSALLFERIRNGEIMAKLYKIQTDQDFSIFSKSMKGPNWQTSLGNPLSRPVELCNEIIVDPIRKSLVDSLTTFVRTRCRLQVRKEGEASGDKAACTSKVAPSGADEGRVTGKVSDARLANSVQMSDFMRRYERFCIFNNYTFEEDSAQVKDKLMRMGFPVRSFLVDRVYGLRWREEVVKDLVRLSSFSEHLRPLVISQDFNFTHFLQRNGHLEGLLARFKQMNPTKKVNSDLTEAFLRIFCEVTGRRTDYVSYESMDVIYLDGSTVKSFGFQKAFQKFCWTLATLTKSEGNIHATELSRFEVSEKVLRRQGPRRDLLREEILRALRWSNRATGEHRHIDLSWVYLQWVTVTVHMGSLLCPPLCCFAIFQFLQDGFARTTASTVTGHPLSNHDLLEILYTVVAEPKEYSTLLSWKIATGYTSASLIMLSILLLSKYVEHYLWRTVNAIRRYLFALLLTSYFVFLVAFLACSTTWVILLAFLHPEEYLPQGTAVVVFFGSLEWQRKRLQSAALTLKVGLEEEMHRHIRRKIVTVIRRARAQAGETDVEILFKDKTIDSKEIDFNPNDLFVIVDHSSDDMLERHEFDEIFAWLNLDIGEERKNQMFAYCDTAGTGTVSREEFVKAWDWLEKTIYESVASGVGLSTTKLYLLLIIQAVVLLLVFAFLFLATVAFATNGSFNAVIQSLAITFVGYISAQARQKVRGEEILEQGVLGKFLSHVI